jgi:tetratricopeptide (TPR) repeat protein
VIEVLRPWLVALALVGCGLIALTAYAWRVEFRGPAVVSGLSEAAANVRLRGIAMSLRIQAAELRRNEVRRLRAQSAPAAARTQARFALADELRDAALLAEADGDLERAREWMAEAAQAAPERADLRCLLTDLRTREAAPDERRMELLRLVYHHDAPCAHVLAAESFLAAGDTQAARAYLQRAAEADERWAEAHLALARLDLREGDAGAAHANAAQALSLARDLRLRLSAAAVLRAAGGSAPSRVQLTAQWAWRSYAYVLPAAGVFVLLLVSPALVASARRGVAWMRSQRGTAESAS